MNPVLELILRVFRLTESGTRRSRCLRAFVATDVMDTKLMVKRLSTSTVWYVHILHLLSPVKRGVRTWQFHFSSNLN